MDAGGGGKKMERLTKYDTDGQASADRRLICAPHK